MAEKRKSSAVLLLTQELGDLERNSNGFSVGAINDNVFHWKVTIMGQPGTVYESGILNAEMIFPLNYPYSPPVFKFVSDVWHPNVDKKGNVCISILHEPGEDVFGHEHPSERWSPVHKGETVIVSIMSLLDAPNPESPANIDAAKQYINEYDEYIKTVKKYVSKSISDL